MLCARQPPPDVRPGQAIRTATSLDPRASSRLFNLRNATARETRMSNLARRDQARVTGAELLRLLLADKRSAATKRAYAADLRDFFGEDLNSREVERFVTMPPAEIARLL